MSTQDHFQRLACWLNMEAEAELERLARRRNLSAENAEATGESIMDLVVDDHDTGLGGRFLLSFIKRNRTLPLPWNRLRVGSPVVLTDMDAPQERGTLGVVSRRSERALQVAVDDWPDASTFRVDLAADELTRKRQRQALQVVVDARGRLAELRKTLLGERTPRFRPSAELTYVQSLDASQQQAVCFSMAAEDVALIHGPPGTGKTTAPVEVILQAVLRGAQVLACAPSNTAVDHLVERLTAQQLRVVRLGHPARVAEELRSHTLDELVRAHENHRIIRDLMRRVEMLHRQAGRYTRAKPARGSRAALRQEARDLRTEARGLERQAVQHTLDSAQVICATTTLDEELLSDRRFDLVVIDEACQSTEPGCWIPVLRAERVVMSGDPCQLPPTVISTKAAAEGFNVSLFERLQSAHNDLIARQLTMQYRMHAEIMQFSSDQFYAGSLTAHDTVAHHCLQDLPDVVKHDLTAKPITFIDTAGTGWEEETEPDGESRRNPSEADLLLRKVRSLVELGLPTSAIAVITPYAAQVRWLREHWDGDPLEIDSVDGFQGREQEAVLISLVRSNDRQEIGFLADTRRMNVALTRARRKLLVIGDSATLASHPFYRDLLEYFEAVGAYQSAWEEM